MRIRVIGLGNTILRDDGIGIRVAREVARRLGREVRGVEVVETEVAGFALLELFEGNDAVILVDAIRFDDLEPATVARISPDDLRTSLRIRSVHEIDLPTALALGRRLGFSMPGEIVIFGIQVRDTLTFGETMTPELEAVIPEVADRVCAEVDRFLPERGRKSKGRAQGPPLGDSGFLPGYAAARIRSVIP